MWGYFSANGVGPLHRIKGTMDIWVYLDVMAYVGLTGAIALCKDRISRGFRTMIQSTLQRLCDNTLTTLKNMAIRPSNL